MTKTNRCTVTIWFKPFNEGDPTPPVITFPEEDTTARCLFVGRVNDMYVGLLYVNNLDGKGWEIEYKTGPCGIKEVAAGLIDTKYPDLRSALEQPVIVLK